MEIWEILLIGVGLAMDAFAISICKGLAMGKATLGKALAVGLYFGVFQGVMPVIGFLLGTQFADAISMYDHWIVFLILTVIGGKMVFDSRSDECPRDGASISPAKMLPLAIATSIDALAVGVSFAFLQIHIAAVASIIGVITLIISMSGVLIGSIFGTKFRSKATLAGGAILILLGIKILISHLMGISA